MTLGKEKWRGLLGLKGNGRKSTGEQGGYLTPLKECGKQTLPLRRVPGTTVLRQGLGS